jgi:hypothetical protein
LYKPIVGSMYKNYLDNKMISEDKTIWIINKNGKRAFTK